MRNIPTFDVEMKAYIMDCANAGMPISAICDELHRQDFLWVREHDVAAVIEYGKFT